MAGGHGKIAWADGKELEEKFAAVAEVITAMEQLPAEINRHALEIYTRHCKEEEVQVCKVARVQGRTSSVALIAMEKGDRQPARIDSGQGGDGDVRHCLSCLYFCGDAGKGKGGASAEGESGEVNRSGALRLTNSSDGTSSLVEAKNDRLVVWRSQVRRARSKRQELARGAKRSECVCHLCLLLVLVTRFPASLARFSSSTKQSPARKSHSNSTNLLVYAGCRKREARGPRSGGEPVHRTCLLAWLHYHQGVHS